MSLWLYRCLFNTNTPLYLFSILVQLDLLSRGVSEHLNLAYLVASCYPYLDEDGVVAVRPYINPGDIDP